MCRQDLAILLAFLRIKSLENQQKEGRCEQRIEQLSPLIHALYNGTPSKPMHLPLKRLPRPTLEEGKPLTISDWSTNPRWGQPVGFNGFCISLSTYLLLITYSLSHHQVLWSDRRAVQMLFFIFRIISCPVCFMLLLFCLHGRINP